MNGIPFLLWAFPVVVLVTCVAVGVAFTLIERAQRAKLPRYDHFGSRRDG